MSHLTKQTIIVAQREAFANASDAFELTPSLGSWRDLETQSLAFMRANVMQEDQLVALLSPYHSSVWSAKLAPTGFPALDELLTVGTDEFLRRRDLLTTDMIAELATR
jgi:hypothetical protein